MRIIKPSATIEKLAPGMEILRNIERAARTCYKSEDRITEDSTLKFIGDLLKHDPPHLSVFEHENMTVRIICDRGVTHELVRHRLVSYSQESTRYCNYSKGKYGGEITLIKPMFWEELSQEYGIWYDGCVAAETSYLRLLSKGAKAQEARSVLPNSLKTEIVTTANMRQWGHIFYQRTSAQAHPQMREVMIPLLMATQKRVPLLYNNLSIYR